MAVTHVFGTVENSDNAASSCPVNLLGPPLDLSFKCLMTSSGMLLLCVKVNTFRFEMLPQV